MLLKAFGGESGLVENKEYLWRKPILSAFLMSLYITYFDFLTYMIRGFFRPPTFGHLMIPLGATIVVVVLVYLILWFMVFYPIGRFLKLEPRYLAVSLGGVIGALYILILSHSRIEFGSFPSDLRILLLFAGCFLICFLIGWATFICIQKISQKARLHCFLARLFLSMPYLLAELFVAVWIHKFVLNSKGWGLLAVYSAFLAIGAMTLIICIFLIDIRKLYRLLLFLSIISIAGSWGSYINEIRKSRLSTEDILGGHSIKHVILICVDTLRADALSCYGNTRISTSNIDRLAEDSVHFEKAFSSSSWTIPSVASFMTGLSPEVHTATSLEELFPADKIPTLAQYMKDEGYMTCGMVANGILWREDFNKGFMTYPKFGFRKGHNLVGGFLRFFYKRRKRNYDSTLDVTETALKWLSENADKDFFLWLHYLDPHLPYSPPVRFLEGKGAPREMGNSFNSKSEVRSGHMKLNPAQRVWVHALYEAEVRYVDECIGKVISHLKELGIYDQALIVFTSDHGEEFWEHDNIDHGHTLYNELLAIPLMFKLPKSSNREHFATYVTNCAITPTVLDLTDIEYESEYLSVDSLRRYWERTGDDFEEAPIIGCSQLYYEEKDSIIFDGMKYIRSYDSGREELYSLDQDPEERLNLIHEVPESVKKAENILAEHQEESSLFRKHFKLEKDKQKMQDQEAIENLRSLGYIH